ncbi:hypothetical protein GSI_14156 [Ganoderma sinense ZZ0214-1]|uniref:Alcohol dehydrogenase-like C-terminal domain-containing protein n=1 Tax=Ganoderma sinense ZZ0214-1 TaxID=1077348 RepID=A0A2G8RSD3_9APHY|nr:hypothetical protein GSI_14156 [Ganoderma sinense ZZ0214-1]
MSIFGKNASSRKVGDHVAGFFHGGYFEDEGAFAEYVKTPADLAWFVPPNALSHDESASLSCATCIASLDWAWPHRLRRSRDRIGFWLTTEVVPAVDQCVILLAHASGHKVATTVSPHNFNLVKALGADAVFDYRDPEVVAKIKKTTGGSLTKAVDAISDLNSQRISAESLGPKGGKIVLVQSIQEGATERKDVVLQPSLLYKALGREFESRRSWLSPA